MKLSTFLSEDYDFSRLIKACSTVKKTIDPDAKFGNDVDGFKITIICEVPSTEDFKEKITNLFKEFALNKGVSFHKNPRGKTLVHILLARQLSADEFSDYKDLLYLLK